jgi:hypothetical protein
MAAVGLVACGKGKVGVASPFDVEFRHSSGGLHLSLPSSVGAGLVSLRLKNSTTEPHDAQLVRVTGHQTADEVIDFFRSTRQPDYRIPSWIRGGGGARDVPAGETVVVKQRLEEGDWYLVDPGFLDDGGVVPFTATSGGSAAEVPKADSRIIARDYSFTPRALKPGTHEVRFENRGKQVHEVVAMRLVPGRTLDEAKAYLSDPNRPVAPRAAPVEISDPVRLPMLDRSKSLVTELKLGTGTWVLTCLLPDRAGGPLHAARGMVADLKVG